MTNSSKKSVLVPQNDTRIYCVDNIKDLLKSNENKNNCYDSPSNNAINVSNKGKITKNYVQCNIKKFY